MKKFEKYTKNIAKSIFFFIFSVFAISSFAQEKRPCDIFQSILDENSISYTVQYLTNANGTEFPFSLLISKNEKKSDKTLFVIIPQSSAIKMQEEVNNFLKDLKDLRSNYSITVALTANDYCKIDLEEKNLKIPGTTTFISNQNLSEKTCAIIISDFDKNEFLYACKNKASPSQFVKDILESCSQEKISLKFKNGAVPFLRKNIAKSNPILEYLNENDIPALHINPFTKTENKENIFYAIEYFVENFDKDYTEEWDSQYFSFSFFKKNLFLNQKTLIIILSVAVLFSLFFICFSFIFGSAAFSDSEKLKKIFYLGFLILLVLFISFELSQLFCIHAVKHYDEIPILAFGTKISIAILIYLTLSSLKIFIPIPQSPYIYGYLVNISSFFNIMFFSLYDLAFLPYFVIIYILNFAFWKTKNKIFQIILFSISNLIFLPVLLFSIKNQQQTFLSLVNCSLLGNFLLASFCLPSLLMILTYRVSIHKYKNYKIAEWKEFLPRILITVGILIIMLIIYPTFNFLGNSRYKNNPNIIYETLPDSNENFPYLSVTENSYIHMDNQQVQLQLESSPSVIRYIVKVASDSLLPIFDANYAFDSFSEKNKAVFYFEENPPQKLNLEFTAKSNKNLDIEIICYVELSTGRLIKNVQKLNGGQ